jgi:cytoplasmic iron level regulating protein YaaA (DUF328/UPF0246 family)
MKVYLVMISDAESSSVIKVCATKEIAVKELFKERNELLEEWKSFIEKDRKYSTDMYQEMVSNLKHDDYEHWDNYPHETPHIQTFDVITK